VKKHKSLFILLWMLTFCLSLQAQQGYTTTMLGPKEGLSHQEVRTIFKDSRGFLWIGTQFGLNFFDGQRFHTFYKIAGDSNSLPHNSIHTITEDKQGRLWIGTQTGVSCFDFLKRKFTNYTPSGKGSYRMDAEHCHVYVDTKETIWIGHNKGIISLNAATGRQTNYPVELEKSGQHRNRYVNSFAEDRQGRLWAATSYGLYFIKPGATQFVKQQGLINPSSGEEAAMTYLSKDSKGLLYCGLWNGGLVKQDEASGNFELVKLSPGLYQQLTVFGITFSSGQAWLSSSAGILQVQENELAQGLINTYSFIHNSGELRTSPGDRYVFFIQADTLGIKWCGTADGLLRVSVKNDFISTVSYLDYSDFNTASFNGSHENQDLFLLTKNQLLHCNLAERKITPVPAGLQGAIVRDIATGKNGYWMTSDKGLHFYDKNFSRSKPVITAATPAYPLLFASVFEDSRGKVWLGTGGRKGISIYEPADKSILQYLHNNNEVINLNGKAVFGFHEDETGDIWIATAPLVRYRYKEKRFEVITIPAARADSAEVNAVNTIYNDRQHKLWLGTVAGLFYYDFVTQSLKEIKLPANIPPRIDGICEDLNGDLWLSSTGGLIFYNRKEQTFRLFNELNGLPKNTIGNSLSQTADGRVLFSYDGGLGIVDPGRMTLKKNSSPPQWTSLLIDNNPWQDEWKNKTITLRYNQSISFSFISPVYNGDAPHQYSYILEGLDKEWTPIGTVNTQRFANLPPGTYTFKVKAGSSEGSWNEEAASFTFRVRPPFWKTAWFIGGIVLLSGLIIYAFYRNRLRQAIAMERLRTRIATDLHDDIGATLSSISMYSEAVKNQVKEQMPHLENVLTKMGENSREMVTNMSDIVWAINPDNDNGKKMVQRMESYARDICAVKNVQLLFEGDKNLDELKLPLEHRKNIYLVFKEALNNALKYAGATQIEIRLQQIRNDTLLLLVKDNGKGFNPEEAVHGNGLKNMQLRSEEIGASLKIITAANLGASIELICEIR
jgi:ligand-binding sensor domain-containing protein/two-component sensor histidine kinase